ncbi:MAG: hypothetical protein ACREDR_00425 [Blastocatellia bacterium]
MALRIPTRMFQLTDYQVKYADDPGDPRLEPARSAEQAARFFARSVGVRYGRTIHVWAPGMREACARPYRYDLRGHGFRR